MMLYSEASSGQSMLIPKFEQSKKDQEQDEINKQMNVLSKTGSKREFLNYLTYEVGNEVVFSWKNKFFFFEGKLKSQDLGKALRTLACIYFIKTGEA